MRVRQHMGQQGPCELIQKVEWVESGTWRNSSSLLAPASTPHSSFQGVLQSREVGAAEGQIHWRLIWVSQASDRCQLGSLGLFWVT